MSIPFRILVEKLTLKLFFLPLLPARYIGYKMPKKKRKKKYGGDEKLPQQHEPLRTQHIQIEMEPIAEKVRYH